jgi:hypothetical protein
MQLNMLGVQGKAVEQGILAILVGASEVVAG